MVPDLAGLVRTLNRAGLRYVVIGGVAVAAHGYVRATEDLDIVPEPSPENLDELGNTLVRIGARLAADPGRGIDPALRQALRRGANLTLTTALGDLDVVQRVTRLPGWDALIAEAETTTLAGAPLAICSRAHLLEMKRARHTLQDQADIEALERSAQR